MTWLIVIDESGNLGSKSKFFVMSAVIVKRVRTLKPVFKAIPKYENESKFYNSSDAEITKILMQLSYANASIVTECVDKYDYTSKYYGKYGNELYHIVLNNLLDRAFGFVGSHDVNLFIDNNSFIDLKRLRSTALYLSHKNGCNLLRCEKAISHQNACIQIVDFVVGAFYFDLQYNDDKFKKIIKERVILCP